MLSDSDVTVSGVSDADLEAMASDLAESERAEREISEAELEEMRVKWYLPMEREAKAIDRFLELHGTALALDLASGIGDPKWVKAFKELESAIAAEVGAA